MISRRQIRIKVMQAVYAWHCTGDPPDETFDINLRGFADQIRDYERQKGDKGDSRLLGHLFYETIDSREIYDGMIQSKAENWELDRIALLDRILMQMGICEMLEFAEIPIKVTINEYLEIAKKFSTPKSSNFINGILDSLYLEFKETGKIQKKGRGLIEESMPKRGPQGGGPRRGGPYNGPRGGGGPYGDGPRNDGPYGDGPRYDGPPPRREGPPQGDPQKKKRPRIKRNDEGQGPREDR